MADDINHSEELSKLISSLPLVNGGVDMAFAYGSGAIPQAGQRTSDNMADFVLSVKDAVKFHEANIAANPFHYSVVRHFGARWNARFQNEYAAKVYCNTLIKVPNSGRMIKYSVIETSELIKDLLDWNTLYISGRLQKPVHFVFSEAAPPAAPLPVSADGEHQLRFGLGANLASAVHAALLQLPETFTKHQLYACIAGLSYQGDFRTTFGEDRQKVTKIVSANATRFDRLYLPILSAVKQVYIGPDSASDDSMAARIVQDGSPAAVYHHLNLLPTTLLWQLQADHQRQTAYRHRANRDSEEVLFAIAHDRGGYAQAVADAVAAIVRRSSRSQSLKNVVTAGPYKTAVYSWRKVAKMLRSMRS